MVATDVVRRLNDRCSFVQHVQRSASNRFVYLVQPWDVAMFLEDIKDILAGRATLPEVIKRNRGADLADPWPVFKRR